MRDLKPTDLTPYEHLALVWHYLGRGQWGPPTEAQRALAEAIASPQYERLAVCMFRGVGKSTVTAAMLPRFWLFNPDLIIGVVAADEKLAKKITGQVRAILDLVPMFRHLRPHGKARKARGALDVGDETTEQTESLWARGIDGNFTGCRADIILVDDGEVPTNCDSQGKREHLWDRYNELGPLLRRDGPCRIQCNGTPHADNSIYWRLQKDKGFKMLVWPARYPSEDEERFHGDAMHPTLLERVRSGAAQRGTPTDRRFDEPALRQALIDCGGEANFRRQYQLDPRIADAERYPLKLRDLMVTNLDRSAGPRLAVYGTLEPIEGVDRVNPGFDGDKFYSPLNARSIEWAEFEDKAVFVDPSGAGQDETAYCVAGWVHGYLCILDWGGNTQWGPAIEGFSDKTLSKLVDLAVLWDCPKIVSEQQRGASAFTALLQKHVRASGRDLGVLDLKVPQVNKRQRIIDAVRPFAEQHRLILNRPIIERDYNHGGFSRDSSLAPYRALYQFTHASATMDELEHDDRVDALALACFYWRERAAIDATEAMRRLQEAQDLAELAAMMPGDQRPQSNNGVPDRGGVQRIALTAFDRRNGLRKGPPPGGVARPGGYAVPNNPFLRRGRL